MTTPIIDPSTLSEGQREVIREQYSINKSLTPSEVQNAYQIGIVYTFEWLFGSEFFTNQKGV